MAVWTSRWYELNFFSCGKRDTGKKRQVLIRCFTEYIFFVLLLTMLHHMIRISWKMKFVILLIYSVKILYI